MGLLSLFGKGPLTDKKIDKSAKLAANSFAQPDVRMREMRRLLDDGSTAALRGVLKRFAANASGHIADEEEKRWLEDALVDVGASVVEPLREFIRQDSKLTYALRAYERIGGEAEAVRFFIEVLEAYGPEDHRSVEAKLQLVHALQEHMDDPRVLPALVVFLLDHGDEVRWAVIDLLEAAVDRGVLSDEVKARAIDGLTQLVTDPSGGPRLQRRAVEVLERRGWPASGEAEELAPLLVEDYFIDKKRFVRRRQKKSSH